MSAPGQSNVPFSRQFPWIYGGVCEYCGVLDKNKPGNEQYKLCPHYKDMDMKCVFCKESADHDDVVRMSAMKVIEDPYLPGQLVTLCGRWECTRKFEQKYNISPTQ